MQVRDQVVAKKKVQELFRTYSAALGIPPIKKPFSVKCHLIRICTRQKKIAAAVRPLAGKVSQEQLTNLCEYILANPLDGCEAEKILFGCKGGEKPPAAPPHHGDNPKIDRRIRKTAKAAAVNARQAFYDSWDWKRLRMEALLKYGRTCMCCGVQRGDTTPQGAAVKIHVDHIKPISRFWELRLDLNNLQILCQECNQGKGAWNQTDWRAA